MSAIPLSASSMAHTFIFAKLANDAQVTAVVGQRIFSEVAPEGTAFPCIVFAQTGLVDTTALGQYRTLSRAQYVVKGITDTGSLAALDALMQRVDKLLHAAPSVAYTQGYVSACTRQGQIVLGAPDAGKSFRQYGNLYEIVIVEDQSYP